MIFTAKEKNILIYCLHFENILFEKLNFDIIDYINIYVVSFK